MTKAWNVVWNGHNILVRNTWVSGEELWIDGICCAQGEKIFALSGDLRAVIRRPDGSEHEVVAQLRQGSLGLEIVCHILVDGVWVGGDTIPE